MAIDQEDCLLSLCAPAQDLLIRWEDIQMGEQIGSGGFADVFKGTYAGVVVAVKRWKQQKIGMGVVRRVYGRR